jgi:hypothetical protein
MRLLLTTAAVAALALPPAGRAEGPAREDPGAALQRARAEVDRAKARLEVARAQLREGEARKEAEASRTRLAEVSYLHSIGLAYRAWQEAPKPAAKPKAIRKGAGDKLHQILQRLETIERRLDALEKKGRGAGEEPPPLQVTPADNYPEDAEPTPGGRR